MPTYGYECVNCKFEFDSFHKISEPPLSECPKCKGRLKRHVGGGTGLIFKGSGFYVNDYKRKAPCSGADKECKPDKSQDKQSKGEGKPKAGGCQGGCCSGQCPTNDK